MDKSNNKQIESLNENYACDMVGQLPNKQLQTIELCMCKAKGTSAIISFYYLIKVMLKGFKLKRNS